jgi:hypothetical protein
MNAERDGSTKPRVWNRRRFLGHVGGASAALATGALTTPPAALAGPLEGDVGDAAILEPLTDRRVIEARALRMRVAVDDAHVPAATNVENGDQARYADHGGTYSKGLPHDSYGRVNPDAFESFTTALDSGRFADFENIIMGGTRKLNGPLGGLAFDLEALDSIQFGQPEVPPAPAIASDESATELLEHYWASLLRDVAFTHYASSPLAGQAAAELGPGMAAARPRLTCSFAGRSRVKRSDRTSHSFSSFPQCSAPSRSASKW